MDTGSPTRRRSTRDGRARVRRRRISASVVVPVLLVLAAYAGLLRPALTNVLIAAAAAGLLILVLIVATLGTERTSNLLLVLSFLLAPLAGLSLGSQFISAATLVFLLAFALALPQLVHRPLRLPAMFLIGSALLFMMGLLAIPNSLSWVVSSSYFVTVIVALVIFPAFVVWMRPNQRMLFLMAVAFGVGTAISTLYGVPRGEYRNSGLTYHPVALAYTAMLTLSLVPFIIASKERYRWIVTPPLVLVALVGVWTSGSRTSIVVLAALVVLVPMFERSIRLGLAVVAGMLLVLPTIFALDPVNNSTSALSRLFGGGGARASDQTRIGTLKEGLEHIKEHPILGSGYSVETHTIHNLYLQILEAEGILGLVGLLLLATALILPLRTATAPMRCLSYPALAFILAGPFQPNMSDHYLGLCLGMSLCAAVGVMNERERLGSAGPTGTTGTLGAPRPTISLEKASASRS